MFYQALASFIMAIMVVLSGFLGMAATAVGIARILFFIFLVFFAISLLIHAVRRPEG